MEERVLPYTHKKMVYEGFFKIPFGLLKKKKQVLRVSRVNDGL